MTIIKGVKYALLFGGALAGLLQSNLAGFQPILSAHVFAVLTAVVPIVYGMIEFAEKQLQGVAADESKQP